MNSDIKYWVGFNNVPGIGRVRLGQLESYFGGLEAAWNASLGELKRAGLDYHEYAGLVVHKDWAACCTQLQGRRMFAFSTRASQLYTAPAYHEGDVLLFGQETRGLPREILESLPPEQRLRLPLRPANRSLNLSNAVAVAVYEAWRQQGFDGGA